MPHDAQQDNLLSLQTAAEITKYRNIDAGSVYALSKSLQSIAASFSQFQSLELLAPAQGKAVSELQTLLEEDNMQKIVGDQIRADIMTLAKRVFDCMSKVWRYQKIDKKAGVDLGMSEAKLQEETKKILVALHQDQGVKKTDQLIKKITEVLAGSVKQRPVDVLAASLNQKPDSELVAKIAEKLHRINDTLMKSIGEQNASYHRTNQLLETEGKLTVALEELAELLSKNTVNSPSSPGVKNSEATASTKIAEFLDELNSATRTDCAHNLSNLVTYLPKDSQSVDIKKAAEKVRKLIDSGYVESQQQLFKGGENEESNFITTLKGELDIKDVDVDAEKLCTSLIEVDKEFKKKQPDSEQIARLLDMKAGLQARMTEAEIASMRAESDKVLSSVTKAWEENMNRLDQANNSGSVLSADKDKLRLQDNTIDKLQKVLFTVSMGIDFTDEVHQKLLACQKQVKHMHLHQSASDGQRQKPTWMGRIRPIFSSHYAFSAITLYSLLAGLVWAASWYVAPMVQGVLQPLAAAFGLCAVEKLISQVHTAYTRCEIAFTRGEKPGFFESFWTMPASGRSNGLLSLAWVSLPHALMGLAAISGAGIYARLASVGRFFFAAERRLQVTAVGLSTVCAGKVLSNHAATPPAVSSLKDVEAEIICADAIQKHFVHRAEETVARDFAVKNKSAINDLVQDEYNDAMKKALTAFSNYNKANNSVSSATLIQELQVIKMATIIESKPKRNILVTRANSLGAEVTKVAVKLAKEDYLSKQQAALTDKHYGFVPNTLKVGANDSSKGYKK